MTVSSTQVDALKTYIGQGEVFNLVTAPATGTALAINASGIPAGTAGSGLSNPLGLTSGVSTLEYKPTFKGTEVEQTLSEVAPHITAEAITLKFKCAEATYKRMRVALNMMGTNDMPAPTQVGTTGIYNHWLQIGGKTFVTTDTIALVSKITGPGGQVSGNDKFEWVCLYQALSVDGLKLDWKRGEARMVEVTITGYADPTRPEGDQLAQVGQQDQSSVNQF